jgi:hypothetical protein
MLAVSKLSARALILGLLVCLANADCGGKDAPPATPSSGSSSSAGQQSNPVSVNTGRERLLWDQQADDSSALAGYRYAAYVDGARRADRGFV